MMICHITDSLNCTWGNWTLLSNCSSDGTLFRKRVCERLTPDGGNGISSQFIKKDFDIQTCSPARGKNHVN